MKVTINSIAINGIIDISINVTKYSTEVSLFCKEKIGEENFIKSFTEKSNALVSTMAQHTKTGVWVLILSYTKPKIDIES